MYHSKLCNWHLLLFFYWPLQFLIKFVRCFSYMDTEQYEEAVRDYEKVYQTEKTSGKRPFVTLPNCSICYLVFNLSLWQSRAQAFVEDGTAGVKEEQEKRLLQGARCYQECHWGWDQKGLSQTSPDAPPRYFLCAPLVSRIHDLTVFCLFVFSFLLLCFFFPNFLCPVTSSDRSPQRRNSGGAEGGRKEVQGGGRGLYCTFWPEEEDPLWQRTWPGWWWQF